MERIFFLRNYLHNLMCCSHSTLRISEFMLLLCLDVYQLLGGAVDLYPMVGALSWSGGTREKDRQKNGSKISYSLNELNEFMQEFG